MKNTHPHSEPCPMCCYSKNLPPLRMKPLRALVAKVRQIELATGGYICEAPDEVSLTDPDFEAYLPLSGLEQHLVVAHKLCQCVLDRLAPPGDPRRQPDLVLVPMTAVEAQEFRAWQKGA